MPNQLTVPRKFQDRFFFSNEQNLTSFETKCQPQGKTEGTSSEKDGELIDRLKSNTGIKVQAAAPVQQHAQAPAGGNRMRRNRAQQPTYTNHFQPPAPAQPAQNTFQPVATPFQVRIIFFLANFPFGNYFLQS